MSTLRSPEFPHRAGWLAVLACMLAATAGPAGAAGALDQRAEREHQRIANERQRVETTYAAAVRDCQGRFAVTSCVEDARAQRRAGLERLAQEQSALDDSLRKQRASERLEELQDKQKEAEARRAASAAEPPPRIVQRPVPAAAPRGAHGASSPPPAIGLSPMPKQALTAGDRNRNAAEYAEHQAEAASHREAVEKRNAEAAQHKPPAAALPAPALPGATPASATH